MDIIGVTEGIARLLRQEIVAGRISPGTKLNEIEIAQRYGVSRPPLREAFRKLENENLVISIPRKGTYVTGLSVEDCKDLFFTRRIIECAAIDTIARNKNTDLRPLRKALEDAASAPPPLEVEGAGATESYKEIAEFHWKLVEASNSRWLIHCYRTIGGALARFQAIYFTLPGAFQPAAVGHEDVLRSLEEGRYEQAKERLVKHLSETLNGLIGILQDQNPEATAPTGARS